MIAFLNSWSEDPIRGSGTAVAIRQLKLGLETLGHRVLAMPRRPESDGSGLQRLLYNLRILPWLRQRSFDAVVGFDVDGFLLPRAAAGGYCVSLKGVAADEARFEAGPERLNLQLRACAERVNARKADRVLVTSRYCRRAAQRAYGLGGETLTIVPECVDLDDWHRFERSRPRREDARPTILNVAHQYPRKDTETLLEAVALLKEEVPDVQLEIVGTGPRLAALRRHARELGLERNTRFLGGIRDRASLMQRYFEADVFCLPSRQEGFGIVFLEAMAAGLPIVAARAGAVPEVIGDGEVGLLLKPGDAEELRDKLALMLGNSGLRLRFSEAARERAEKFGTRRVAQAFLAAVGL
ncbi:MAG: glycosyltransferase family 4 protein [Acidobacteriota bacterium]